MKIPLHLNLFFGLLSCLLTQILTAQVVTVNAGLDVAVCPSNATNLTAIVTVPNITSAYTSQAIPYLPDPFNAGTALTFTGNQWSGAINIGFTFCFYTVPYNQIVIGSNGIVSFNLANANQACPAGPTGTIPSAVNMPVNAIGGAFQDLQPELGGSVRYAVYGTAPTRRFVVSWENMSVNGCFSPATQQIVLYETTNVIEVFIQTKPSCPTPATEGLQNGTGTVATSVVGRNGGTWAATNDGRRFRPTGTPVFSLTWLDGGGNTIGTTNTVNVSPAATTTYTCTVNYVDCTGQLQSGTDQVQVTVRAATATHTPPACAGGTLQLQGNMTGGGTVNYSWSGPPAFTSNQQNPNIAGAQQANAGTYTVTTTGGGCTLTASTAVTMPAPILPNMVVTPIGCLGQTNAALDLTPSGGTAPYSFLWENGTTTEDRSGLGAGTYSVTVTESLGCTGSATTTIVQPAAFTLSATGTPAACFGGTGSATATPNGGGAPFTYLWSNGATGATATGLAPGTYSVTGTAGGGCTASTTVNLASPPVFTVAATSTNILCFGATNGTATATVTGGTAPFSFLWSNGGTGSSLTGLGAGTYSVTATGANGCTASASATVNPAGGALAATLTAAPQTCAGLNGSINLTVSGGTPAYAFLWSNGATTEDLAGIVSGNYQVTVTDANSCTASFTQNVGQNLVTLTLATVGINPACFGGTNGGVNLTVSGGTPAYTFLWSNAATTEDLNGLAAGTYSVTATDANGCTGTTTRTLTAPTAVALSATATSATCTGATGSVNLTVSGGTPAYAFLWSNGATTEDLAGIVSGNYQVTVTDANGCTASFTRNVGQNLVTLTLATVGTNPACFGGTNGGVNLTVSGGTPAYTFLWSNAATTEDINGLAAGTYSVTATDANGCTGSGSGTLAEPAAIALSATATDANCTGATGGVDLTVSGGTPTYAFSWSNGATTEDLAGVVAGNYQVTVTDANGCTASFTQNVGQNLVTLTLTANGTDPSCFGGTNGGVNLTVSGGTPAYTFLWSNAATTEDISGLAAGTYSVTATDANGCTGSGSGTLAEPTAIALSATATDATCAGATGGVDLTVSGGTPAYAFLWSNGATTEDLTGIVSGNYQVTVTDANGCTASFTQNVGQNLVTLTLTANGTDPSCFGGANGGVNLTVSGGTPAYTFLWSNAATTEDINALAAGTYSVTATDANGCSGSGSGTLAEPAAIGLSATATDATCAGATGGVDLTVSGGTPSYAFLWSNGASTEDLTGIVSGNYQVTVTDANGCTASFTQNVGQNLVTLALTANGTDPSCFGGTNGGVNLTVSGGTPAYTFLWSNAATTEDLNALAAGTYSVTATDANGCTGSGSGTLAEPTAIALSATTTGATCFGNNGSIELTVSGGTPDYTFAWAHGATTEDILGTSSGLYEVTVTDANGCTATISANVDELPDLTPPVIVCGANETLTATDSLVLPTFFVQNISDDCGLALLSQSPAPGTVFFTNQNITVTFTATDGAGNTSTCSIVVSINLTPACGPLGTIYVNDNALGNNTGTSWFNAFTSLQSALAIATPGQEIWVAEGTYRPSTGVIRPATFSLRPGVSVYGGFPDQGGVCTTTGRDWVLYPTILSGDLGVQGNNTDNSFRVVTATNVGAAARLDGFTVRDGYSNNNGAGIVVQATTIGATSSPVIANCIFEQNFTPFKGGAAYVYATANNAQANPLWQNVVFRNNSALSDGGAMVTIAQSGGTINLQADSCVFQNNNSGQRGGALNTWVNSGGVSTVNFSNTTFTGNTAAQNGGAYWNFARQSGGSTANFAACTFSANSGVNGGAIFNQPTGGTCNVNIQNSILSGNTASASGGAIGQLFNNAVASVSNITVGQSQFLSNTAGTGGGALSINSNMTTAVNTMTATGNFNACLFAENTSGTDGGATHSFATGGTTNITNTFRNCIFSENSATRHGGAIYAHSLNGSSQHSHILHSSTSYRNTGGQRGGFAYLEGFTAGSGVFFRAWNSIFWADGTPLVLNSPFNLSGAYASAQITNCLLPNLSCAANFTGNTNYTCTATITGNPLFTDPATGDFHLQAGSPALDAGTPFQAPATDYDGAPRPVGQGYDLGAFERQTIAPRLAEAAQDASVFVATAYPNPTTGEFVLSFDRPLTGAVQIFDVQGRLVQSFGLIGNNQVPLSLAASASGAYLVRIVSDETVRTLTVLLKRPY